MTTDERSSMARASAILLAAALLRSLATPGGAPPAPAPGEEVTDSLLRASDSAAADKEARSKPLRMGETVDLNRATEVDLDRLPGIGPAKAGRIVEDRRRNGSFSRVEDLKRVPGLGSKTVERLGPYLSIGVPGASNSPEPAKGALPQRRLLGVTKGPALPVRNGRMDLNRATKAELETLPGIGPVMAARIIALRDARGGFDEVRQLMQVSGIGERTFAALAELVTAGR